MNRLSISIRVFFQRHWQFTRQQGKGGDYVLFLSTILPAHEYSDIYLLLCIWNDYHIFLIASVVTKRLLLDKIYHLFELLFD